MRSLKAIFSPAAPYAMLPIRLMLFVVFFYHGTGTLFGWFDGPGLAGTARFLASAGVPASPVFAFLFAVIQVAGSVAFLVGAGVRLFSILMIGLMMAGTVGQWAFEWEYMAGGIEYNVAIIAMCLGLLFGGPGWASIEWADEEGAAPGAIS